MKCYYHDSDFDGKCSAAIVHHKYPDCWLEGINYDHVFDHSAVKENETVFIVDFSISDEDLVKLCSRGKVIFIDHHDTAIVKHNEAKKSSDYNNNLIAVLDNSKAATQLCWETLFKDIEIPYGVKLIADYDIWDHKNIHTVYLQHSLHLRNIAAWHKDFWKLIFENDKETMKLLLSNGMVIDEYLTQYRESYSKSFAFETEFEGHLCLAINAGRTNSKMLENMFDKEKYGCMIIFCRNGKRKSWTVSLYGPGDGKFHCGELAQKYGGGGHRGAAGFFITDPDGLPFKI